PPRATPGEYQAQAQAGTVTIAAEFTGHSVPTLEGALSTEDYVVIETALFGSPGARIKLSSDDFSLRINGKKTPLPSQPYGLVVGSVKDPEWEPPIPAASKSKTSLGGGGNGEQREANAPPAPVQIPIEVKRAMAQRLRTDAPIVPEILRALSARLRSRTIRASGPAGSTNRRSNRAQEGERRSSCPRPGTKHCDANDGMQV